MPILNKSFKITEDQFALTDRKLVNHKQYHFIAIAYAYNNWKNLDIVTSEGQKRAYLVGRQNIGIKGSPYTFVPRPIVYEQLQAKYGDGPQVTRLAGEGNPGKFLDMDETMYELILKKTNDGKILYKSGAGPIDAKVVDPLKIKDGKYRLEITGNFSANAASSTCAFDDKAVWKLSNVTDPSKEVVLHNGTLYLTIVGPFYAVLGILMQTRYALQGIGQKLLPLISSLIEFFGKIIFVIFLIPRFQYMAVIFCEPVIWCVMTVQLVYSFYHNPYIKNN